MTHPTEIHTPSGDMITCKGDPRMQTEFDVICFDPVYSGTYTFSPYEGMVRVGTWAEVINRLCDTVPSRVLEIRAVSESAQADTCPSKGKTSLDSLGLRVGGFFGWLA